MLFERVDQALVLLREVLAQLDPAVLAGADAVALLDRFAQGRRLCEAGTTLCAKRVEDANAWQGTHRSAASWLAARTGESLGSAIATLDTARVLDDAPATTAALRAGSLSAAQAKELAAAVAADPLAEDELLAAAGHESLAGLRERCRAVRAAGDDDRDARIYRSRSLRTWSDHEGAGCGAWRLPPAAHAMVVAALEGRAGELFDEARREGRREPAEAYAADALVELVTGRAEPSVHLEVVAELAPDEEGEASLRYEIPGVGPVSAAGAKRLLGDAFVTLLVREGIDITAVVSAGHSPSAAQKRAVRARDGHRCVVEGCGGRRRLEIHHVDGYHPTRVTTVERLCLLCSFHHDLCSYRGYRITGVAGQWRLVGPDPPPGPGHRHAPRRRGLAPRVRGRGCPIRDGRARARGR